MKPIDRVLCVTPAVFGMVAFIAALKSGRPVEIGLGIAALVVGLAVVPLVVRLDSPPIGSKRQACEDHHQEAHARAGTRLPLGTGGHRQFRSVAAICHRAGSGHV